MEEDLQQKCVESGLKNYNIEVGGEKTRSSLECKIIKTRDEDGEVLNNLEIVASPPGTVSVGVNKYKTGKHSSDQITVCRKITLRLQPLLRFLIISLYRK